MKKTLLYFFLLAAAITQAQGTYESLSAELESVKKKCRADGRDKGVYRLMESLQNELLEADNGQLSDETIAAYKTYANDPTLHNSHIFYLFQRYQDEAENPDVTSDFQLGCMKLLSAECISTYKAIPAIVLVYMGEALMAAGMDQKAGEHFEMALSHYPDSVPIKVYRYSLAPDGPAKENMKKHLLKKHPNHWMVKDMVK